VLFKQIKARGSNSKNRSAIRLNKVLTTLEGNGVNVHLLYSLYRCPFNSTHLPHVNILLPNIEVLFEQKKTVTT